jgi:hypothetical protein
MRGSIVCLLSALVLVGPSCGGGTGEADDPTDEYGVNLDDYEEDEDEYDEVEQPSASDSRGGGGRSDEEGERPKAPPPEPKFEPGMSVSQAINAVPPGIERVNIEEEELARPLGDMTVYKPCKLGPAAHFKVKVAVWNGRAVGIDVEAKDANLAQCIRRQIEGLTWRDKARSLNTVEYQY